VVLRAVSKSVAPILLIVLLTNSNISIGDMLVYKCVVDNVPTYQNIPCPQSESAQDQDKVMHMRSDRNVVKSWGSVQSRQEQSTSRSVPNPNEYQQTYGKREATNPTLEGPFEIPEGQRYDSRWFYQRFGPYQYPGEENTSQPRRRFQGRELKFKEIKPRELEFRSIESKTVQNKEMQFRQIQSRHTQSRGISTRSVQSKGISPRTPQSSEIKPLLDSGDETTTDNSSVNR